MGGCGMMKRIIRIPNDSIYMISQPATSDHIVPSLPSFPFSFDLIGFILISIYSLYRARQVLGRWWITIFATLDGDPIWWYFTTKISEALSIFVSFYFIRNSIYCLGCNARGTFFFYSKCWRVYNSVRFSVFSKG